MSYNPSVVASKILSLIANAKDLSLGHQRRTIACDVIKACKILAKGNDFKIDDSVFDMLEYSIQNKQQQSLSEDFDKAEENVVLFDISSRK